MGNLHCRTFYSSSFKDKNPSNPQISIISASMSPSKPTNTWSKAQYSFQSIQHHTQTLTKRRKKIRRIIITTWKKQPTGYFHIRLDGRSPLFFHCVWISTLDHWTTCCTKEQMKWQTCLCMRDRMKEFIIMLFEMTTGGLHKGALGGFSLISTASDRCIISFGVTLMNQKVIYNTIHSTFF